MSKRLSSLSGLFARNKTDVANNRKSPSARSLNLEALESRELLDAAPIASLAANPIRETPAILCDAMLDDTPAIDLFDLPGEYEAAVKLDAPVVTSTSSDSSSITVSWDAVPNATRYSVGYKLSSESSWTSVNAQQALSLTINSLEPYSRYDVRVLARGDGSAYANSDWSTTETVRTEALNPTTWVVTSSADSTSKGSLRYAINHAAHGDTITFASALKGKTISLKSTLGQLKVNQAVTIDASNLLDATTSAPGLTLNGGGHSRIMNINVGDARDVSINGLVFTNGYVDDNNEDGVGGGGIFCESDSVLNLENCVISGNTSSYWGGGGLLIDGQATLTNCSVTQNASTDDSGGGIYAGSYITLTDCVISGNTAAYAGGGLFLGGHATLTNCSVTQNESYHGGGISTGDSSNVTLTDCVISGNTSNYWGGGGLHFEGQATLTNCAVTQNASTDDWGGGIYAYYASNITLTDCEISGNTAAGGAGGLLIRGQATLTNCAVAQNTSSGDAGGGIFFTDSSNATLTDCVISGNTSYYWGGGGLRLDGQATLTNCSITNNSVEGNDNEDEQFGGGVRVRTTNGVSTFENCLIAGNSAYDGGGLFVDEDAKANVVNCTITKNNSQLGGGVSVKRNGEFGAYNSIVYGNTSIYAAMIDVLVYAGSDGSGTANAYNTLSGYVNWTGGQNNLSYDATKPLFNNAASGDYSLAQDSQAINKGNNQYVTTNVDLGGQTRILNDVVDLGAYERKVPVKLPAPVITSTSPDVSSITVVWDAVPNATRYSLYYKLASETSWISENPGTATSYTISGLASDSDYQIRLRARGNGEDYTDSGYSATVDARTIAPVKLDAPIPSVAAKTATTITCSWTEVPNATGYKFIWKNKNDAAYTPVVIRDALTTSHKIIGLENDAVYWWKVLALGDNNAFLNSPYCPTQVEKPQQTLATPNLTVEPGRTSLTLSWNADPNAAGYKIMYKVGTAPYDTITINDAKTSTYTIDGLAPNSKCSLKMAALGDGIDYKNSAFTPLASYSTANKLATPAIASVSSTAGTVTITWNAIDSAASYTIVCGSETYEDVPASATSFTIPDLEPSANYSVTIQAIGGGASQSSDVSDPATIKTKALVKLATPTLTVSATTGKTATLTWTAPTNGSVDGYMLAYRPTSSATYTTIRLDPNSTTFTLTGLTQSTNYAFKIRALGGDGIETTSSSYGAVVKAKTTSASQAILDLGDELFDELEADYDLLAENFVA